MQLDNKPKNKYRRVFNTLKTFCSNINPESISTKKEIQQNKPSPYKVVTCDEMAEANKKRREEYLAKSNNEAKELGFSNQISDIFSKVKNNLTGALQEPSNKGSSFGLEAKKYGLAAS